MKSAYSAFYAILKNMPDATEDTKKTLILQYTKYRTSHLHEMKWDEYTRMIRDLNEKFSDYVDMNLLRRRAIAAVFSFFEMIKEKRSMGYVKAVIVRASGSDSTKMTFNKLSEQQLRRVYSEFVRKVKAGKATDEQINVELEKSGYYD